MDDAQRTLPSAFVVHPKTVNGSPPNKYCWLGADGYTMGTIELAAMEGYNMIIEGHHIQHQLVNGRYDYPLDIAITEYHVLLLYSDRLEAVSLLNQKCIFEEPIGMHGSQVKGMYRDPITEMIWIYTDSSVIRYQPDEETRNVWAVYLERGEFRKAKELASKLRDNAPYQLVLKKEAEKFISEKNFIAAAELLAESEDSFEISASRFFSTVDDRRDGLKRFLELQFKKIKGNSVKDRMKRSALVLCLTEIQLARLGELKLAQAKTTPAADVSLSEIASQVDIEVCRARAAFEGFLADPSLLESIKENCGAMYRLMASHADFESQLFLAQKLKDVKTTLEIHLSQMDYKGVLEVIRSQSSSEYFYEYSPILIEHVPFELVFSWIEKNLFPEKLLPALYRCQQTPKLVAAAFKYLKQIIPGKKATKPVHNFMISLCSVYKSAELLDYLMAFGYDKNDVPYDIEYALRICLEKEDLKRCAIFLYCVMGLYDEAVTLALSVDVELAKDCARRMKDTGENNIYVFLEQKTAFSVEVRRKIWLKIARYIIEEQNDIIGCIDLLKESDDIIKIQDVLPFFPGFTSIKHFKELLTKCVREQSGKIKVIQEELKKAAEIAQQIRTDSDKLKNKSVIIRGSDRCSLCNALAMERRFYAFNCKHFFHRDCIEKHVMASFSVVEKTHYSSLCAKEKVLMKALEDIDKTLYQPSRKHRECQNELKKIRLELCDMIAGECILCGISMKLLAIFNPIALYLFRIKIFANTLKGDIHDGYKGPRRKR